MRAAALVLVLGGAAPADQAFKVSEKANLPIIIKSSEEETDFYVSGTFVGRGKSVPVMIEKDQRYEVKAQPEGCRARQDTISPPYRKRQEIEFQFMISDCAPQIVISAPSGQGEVRVSSLEVAFAVQSRRELTDLAISLNGDKLAAESGLLGGQLLTAGRPGETRGATRPFRVTLRLRPGPNTIRIEATDSESRTGSQTVLVRYDPAKAR